MASDFPRGARLLRRFEIQRVYRLGRCRRGRLLVLFHAPSVLGPEAPSRFGVTVSRKVARLAVDRNRTRRIWREAIRLLRSQFAPGLDIVVNARVKPKGRLTMPEAREELLHLSTQEALLLPAPPSP